MLVSISEGCFFFQSLYFWTFFKMYFLSISWLFDFDRTALRGDREWDGGERGGMTCNSGPSDRPERWAAAARTKPLHMGRLLHQPSYRDYFLTFTRVKTLNQYFFFYQTVLSLSKKMCVLLLFKWFYLISVEVSDSPLQTLKIFLCQIIIWKDTGGVKYMSYSKKKYSDPSD